MNHFVPLPAAVDIGDLIQFAVILLIFIVPVISQVVAKIRRAQQQQPPAVAAADEPRPRRPVPADVAEEIDDFLRRATKQRGLRQARPIRSAPPSSPPVEQPIQAEVVADTPAGEQVGEHVKKYFDAGKFSRRGAQLGKEVVEADRQIDQHLHQVFDHSLGQLATPLVAIESSELSESTAVDVPPTFAAGLAALLTSTDSIRQAIVLSEIIHRPEERWE